MQRDPRQTARRLYQTAASQGGYFTAAQARHAGYAYRQHTYHVSRGTWLRIARGLFRLRDFPAVEREDLMRWSLWSCDRKGSPQAVVSYETALSVHELSDVMPARTHLTVPKGFRKRLPPGCVLHRNALLASEIESRLGYRVTTPLRTLLDVAASPLSQEHLDQAVRDGLQRGLVRRRQFVDVEGPPGAHKRLREALLAAQREETRA